jgi:hypothetical protein
MPSIYEMTGYGRVIEDLITDIEEMIANGEAPEDNQVLKGLYESLVANAESEEQKLEAIVKVIRQAEADAKAQREETERLLQAATVNDNRVKRLKELIKWHLNVTGQKKARAGLFNVSVCGNGGLAPLIVPEIPKDNDQEALKGIPVDYVKTVLQLDTAKVREELEMGVVIEFAKIGERGTHVRIK